MSSFAVTLENLKIEKHPNADALELAKVGEYRAVVPKGVYQTGSIALYIPEQALLPPELIEELGLTGKLAGRDGNRVKAIRLRGELSQGIVCRPKKIAEVYGQNGGIDPQILVDEKRDFAELLGITKWTPEIPASMSGKVSHSSGLVRWLDIENIKRYPDIFHWGEEVIATEKIHGTCCCITYSSLSDSFSVTSKGLLGKSLVLEESESNVYWRAINKYGVKDSIRELAAEYPFVETFGVFGEVYGPGIQDLTYGAKEQKYIVFDVRCNWPQGTFWMDVEQLSSMFSSFNVPQDTAPILYRGTYDYARLARLAEGMETISGTEAHIREGLVVRSMEWDGHVNAEGDRPIAKFINPDYLTRKGGTEYE